MMSFIVFTVLLLAFGAAAVDGAGRPADRVPVDASLPSKVHARFRGRRESQRIFPDRCSK